MIALDLPAIDIGLQQRLQVQLRVGTDQKSGLAVEQLAWSPCADGSRAV
jgi:hypothetical protein